MNSLSPQSTLNSDKTQLLAVTVCPLAEVAAASADEKKTNLAASTSSSLSLQSRDSNSVCRKNFSGAHHTYIIYSCLIIYGVVIFTSIFLIRTELIREIIPLVRGECQQAAIDLLGQESYASLDDGHDGVSGLASSSLIDDRDRTGISRHSRHEENANDVRIKRSLMTSDMSMEPAGEPNEFSADDGDNVTPQNFADTGDASSSDAVESNREFENGDDSSKDSEEPKLRPKRNNQSATSRIRDHSSASGSGKRNSETAGRRRNNDNVPQTLAINEETPSPPSGLRTSHRSTSRKLKTKNAVISAEVLRPGPGRFIHLHAKSSSDRQHVSPSMLSFNSTDTVYRMWTTANWVPSESNDTFSLNERDGVVFIKQSGLYLIYAQMVYHDLTGRWSFGVYVNSIERVKCLASEQLRHADQLHPTSHGVYQHCYTAAPIYVEASSSAAMVNIRCMYGSRTILTQPEFTFWGIVKLS